MRSRGELGARAMYKGYKELTPEGVNLATFILILEEFNKRITKILLNGGIVRLPHRLGDLYIEKKKVNYDHLKLDYGHWQKSGGEKIYHLNRHSDGYHAYFHWRKIASTLIHKGLYKLIPCRANSRYLGAIMKENGGHTAYPLHEKLEKVTPRPPLLPCN